MALNDYVSEIVGFVSGGGLIGVLTFLSKRKKDKKDQETNDFEILKAAYRDEFDRLLKRVGDYEETESRLRKENLQLKDRIREQEKQIKEMLQNIAELQKEINELR